MTDFARAHGEYIDPGRHEPEVAIDAETPASAPPPPAANPRALTLYEKIVGMIGEARRIPKRGWNAEFNYPFATHGDVVEQTSALCAKYGVVVFQHPLTDKDSFERRQKEGSKMLIVRQLYKYEIINADKPAETREILVWGEGADSMDKCSYKASTGADKYFWFRLLQLPTGDDPEATREAEEKQKGAAPKKYNRDARQAERQQTRGDARKGIEAGTGGDYIDEARKRAVFAAAGKANVSHDDLKKYLLEMHGIDSTAKITPAAATDAIAWLESVKG